MKIVLKNSKRFTNNTVYMMFETEKMINVKLGQFVNISIPGDEFTLRRPFSIVSAEKNKFSVLIKVVGSGTQKITNMKIGESIDALLPLGQPFDKSIDYKKTLFVAGGIGIAGILRFIENRNADLLFGDIDGEYKDIIDYLKIKPIYINESGKIGKKGFVTDYINDFEFNTIIACGPKGMLRSIKEKTDKHIKFYAICEEIIACGLGLCSGCAIKYDDGSFGKVCVDGPVLNGRRIDYD